jgi:hypothetical protein
MEPNPKGTSSAANDVLDKLAAVEAHLLRRMETLDVRPPRTAGCQAKLWLAIAVLCAVALVALAVVAD